MLSRSRPRQGFACEADMLAPLRDQRRSVLAAAGLDEAEVDGSRWTTLFEVPTSSGVPDVLHVAFHTGRVADRQRRGATPITDWYEFRTFLALQSLMARTPDSGITVRSLADRLRMTPDGVKRGALARLATAGHVERDGGEVRPTWTYQVPAGGVVAIEAKRTDWRRAAAQTTRYTEFASRSYMALEPGATELASTHPAMLASAQIGVLAVDPRTREVTTVVPAPRSGRLAKLKALFSTEQALNVAWSGGVSGPVLPVFGRHLTVSAGPDPRL